MSATNVAALKRTGAAVTAWMEAAGFNPTDLHKRTGISRATIYRVQEGETEPSLDVLKRIAAEVGASPGQLLDGVLPKAVTPPAPAAAEAGSRSEEAPSADIQQMNRDLRALAKEVARLRKIVEPSVPRARQRAG